VNDLDRWVNLEGPEPDDIRDLLDAACDDRTPEEEERMERRIFAAIAEDRRRWARRRTVTRLMGGGLVAACVAGALALALHLAAPVDATLVRRLTPNVSTQLVGAESTSVSAEPGRKPAPPPR
jgi:hypothetical protein